MRAYKLYLSAFLLLCCMHTAAQTSAVPTDEETTKKKEINKIKLSEEAIYADVMEMATDDAESITLAQRKSREMLQAHVIEVFAKRMKMEKKDVQEIWDVIDDKCQNIVVKKGDLFRVFSYIMKDAIGLTPKRPKKGDVDKYLEAPDDVATTETDASDMAQAEPAPVKTPEAATPQTPAEEPQPEKAEPQRQEAKPQPEETKPQLQEAEPQPEETAPQQAQPQPRQVEPQPEKTETPETPAPAPQPARQPEQPAATPVPAATPAPVAIEMPDRVKTLYAKGSINEVVRYLNTEKQNHTLIYGSMQTMQNQEKCYVVIIDKATKKVVTVLGKGSGSRMNYTTGQPDHLNNYKGGKHSAIFVQEY